MMTNKSKNPNNFFRNYFNLQINTINQIDIKKIIKIASDIWFGLALIMDDIANAAVAPQIAVAEEIKYINFLSKLNNLPINKPKRKVITTKILIIGK